MKPWRNTFHRLVGPGLLPGVTLGTWWRILRENRFAIDLRFLPRAAVITGCSILNTPFAAYEHIRYGSSLRKTEISPPLFVIGHYRSGTTFLHNLLALDPQFAYPNTYQARFGRTFLTTEELFSWLVKFLLPRKRPQDNMELALQVPQEDEFALCAMTGTTPYMSHIFPRRARHYDRYLALERVPASEQERWREALVLLFKKLTLKYGKPLLLKSPPHTARVKELLDLFPEARFVHIHRDPYAVFRSTRNLFVSAPRWSGLQAHDERDLDDRILSQYLAMHEAWFAARDRIRPGYYHELAFEQLERDPIGEVGRIYEALRLPGFSAVADDLMKYVERLASYRKSTYPDLPPQLRQRVASAWSRCFEEWGYSL